MPSERPLGSPRAPQEPVRGKDRKTAEAAQAPATAPSEAAEMSTELSEPGVAREEDERRTGGTSSEAGEGRSGANAQGEGAEVAEKELVHESDKSGGGAGDLVPLPLPSQRSIDLGNLAVFDACPLQPMPSTPAAADEWCLALGTEAVQLLVGELFSLPSSAIKEGRLAKLPPPSTALPREKPVPKPRPPTKWEKFAQTKGIRKRKRGKMEFDESAGEWRRRYGYKRVNDERDIPIIEAKDAAPGGGGGVEDEGEDPFARREKEKKSRVKKQEKNRLTNLKMAAKANRKGHLPLGTPGGGSPAFPIPSALSLSAASLPLMASAAGPGAGRTMGPGKGMPKRASKEELAEAAGLARTATASLGKFDRKLKGAKAGRKTPKALKVLPVAEARKGKGSVSAFGAGAGGEKSWMRSLADAVIAKNDTGQSMDVGKAVSMLNKEKEKGGKRGGSAGVQGKKGRGRVGGASTKKPMRKKQGS